MKRTPKKSLVILVVLALLVSSGLLIGDGYALGTLQNVTLELPSASWVNGNLQGIGGSGSNNIVLAGFGDVQTTDITTMPLVYRGSGSTWTAFAPILPDGFTTGRLQDVWVDSSSGSHFVGYGIAPSGIRPLLYYTPNMLVWNLYDPAFPSTAWKSGELYNVWGIGIENVYAVGHGHIGYFDKPLVYEYTSALGWSSVAVPFTGWDNGYMRDVWGTSATNVYAVGSGNMNSGSYPMIYHRDDTSWSASSPARPAGWSSIELTGVWGSGAGDIYAVGYGTYLTATRPVLYHYYDGTWGWTDLNLPGDWSSAKLYSVWGSSASDVYLVGAANNDSLPILYRKTSSGWAPSSALPVGWSSGQFSGIWGSGTDDVYAAGSGMPSSASMPMLAHAGADTTAPGTPVNFAASPGTTAGSIDLIWTAPSDDAAAPETGPVDSYQLSYATAAISSCAEGTPVSSGVPAPALPGDTQSMTLTGLSQGTQYYFLLCASDEGPNQSLAATANTTTFAAQQVTLHSIAVKDGWILESSEYSGAGGTLSSGSTLFYLGDNAADRQYRTILSFNTSGLPDDAVILGLQLKIRRQGLVGTNPFATHGSLKVDIHKGYFSTSVNLQPADFKEAATLPSAGIFSKLPSASWYTATLPVSAFSQINLTGNTQFRLRFSLDDNNDMGADYLRFYSGNAGAAYRPELIIDYMDP